MKPVLDHTCTVSLRLDRAILNTNTLPLSLTTHMVCWVRDISTLSTPNAPEGLLYRMREKYAHCPADLWTSIILDLPGGLSARPGRLLFTGSVNILESVLTR